MNQADLKALPLFESLGKRDLERVSRWVDQVDVGVGRHLVDQGSFAFEFFVILEGEAEVIRDGDRIAQLGPGDFFGEMALVEGDRRNASVVATTPMRLGVMLGRDFKEMEDELPHVAEEITKAVEARRPR
jgi:CRP-like cAMP-binding protein